jgi:hypothetical protein
MRPIELKIKDLAKVTGYTRFQVDGVLKLVFAAVPIGKSAGAQRTFSPQDLLVVTVICELERKYAIDRKKLAEVATALRQELSGPRPANRDARLLVTFLPASATYLAPDIPVVEGLVLPLGALFAKVDEYLGVSGANQSNAQGNLPLPPAIATNRRGSSRSQ